jgi:thioredoxin 1
MSENITVVSDDSFTTQVLQSTTPVIVDFWAPWCGPCQAFVPVFEKVAKEYLDRVKFVKVNVDDNSKTASEYNVRGIPTIIIFKDGKVADIRTGALNQSGLVEFIDSNLP